MTRLAAVRQKGGAAVWVRGSVHGNVTMPVRFLPTTGLGQRATVQQ
jgi:hypothetical protein